MFTPLILLSRRPSSFHMHHLSFPTPFVPLCFFPGERILPPKPAWDNPHASTIAHSSFRLHPSAFIIPIPHSFFPDFKKSVNNSPGDAWQQEERHPPDCSRRLVVPPSFRGTNTPSPLRILPILWSISGVSLFTISNSSFCILHSSFPHPRYNLPGGFSHAYSGNQ